jgi:hypothetical protein
MFELMYNISRDLKFGFEHIAGFPKSKRSEVRTLGDEIEHHEFGSRVWVSGKGSDV